MHLGAFMRPVSLHTAAWRYPDSYPDANFNFRHYQSFIQTLERGCFDAFFMADHLAVLNMPMAALKRSATVSSFDPLTLLPALAVATEKIGLIATASTTYNDPYHIARKFASLDHISDGRSGWNIVTSYNPHEASNFGPKITRFMRVIRGHNIPTRSTVTNMIERRKFSSNMIGIVVSGRCGRD